MTTNDLNTAHNCETSSDLVQRLRLCAQDPMWADHAEIPKSWCAEAATTIERLTAERDEGEGYVYHNPDAGTEYASSHPVGSGEVHDAEDVRKSTSFEDYLVKELNNAKALISTQAESLAGMHDSYQSAWKRAEAAESLNARQAEALKTAREEAAKVADLEWADAQALFDMHNGMDTLTDTVRARIAGRQQAARHIAVNARALATESSNG